MTRTNDATRRGRRNLILLLALFLVPAGIAWTLFFSGWRPPTTANHGELIEPPVQVALAQGSRWLEPAGLDGPAALPDGRWTLLLRLETACEADCRARLRETRQVRLALGRYADRLQRLMVVPEGAPAPGPETLRAHDDLAVVRVPGDDPVGAEATDGPLAISLVDARGYRMMRYGEPLDPSGMLEDLRHLMRLSNLDLERLEGLTEQE